MKFPLTLALTYVLTSPATAHDYWPNGKPVPDWVKSSCCGKADAHRLRPDQVHQDKTGTYFFTGLDDDGKPIYKGTVPLAKVLPSPDPQGSYWIFYACNAPTCNVFCFFAPMEF
jgi:hypothetical protein